MKLKKKKVKVLDAKIPLIINIKKDDIACARPGDKDNCAVAKAIQRQLGTTTVCVGTKIISIMKHDLLIRFKTPSKIAENLPIFDKTGCWALPFGEYKLLPPSKSYKLATRIADTIKRRRPALAKKKATATGNGKLALYTSNRALHSRSSSAFRKKLSEIEQVRFAS